MYSAVGISGCEPPQPQQFGRKINIITELTTDRGFAVANARNQFYRPTWWLAHQRLSTCDRVQLGRRQQ